MKIFKSKNQTYNILLNIISFLFVNITIGSQSCINLQHFSKETTFKTGITIILKLHVNCKYSADEQIYHILI